MSRIHRGNLATMPPKKFLAARARAQALYPSTADVTGVQAPFRPNESVSFDEFSFTVVLAYNGRQRPGDPSSSEVCHSAAFEYMRFTWEQGVFMFVVSPEDRGQAEVMPWLRAAFTAPTLIWRLNTVFLVTNAPKLKRKIKVFTSSAWSPAPCRSCTTRPRATASGSRWTP